MNKLVTATLFSLSLAIPSFDTAADVSQLADNTARYAVTQYSQPMIDSLAKMVSYQTFDVKGLPLEKNSHFTGYKAYIKSLSQQLGLDYQDMGYMVLVRLGKDTAADKRFGIVTHGDVKPADASKWAKSPFELDSTTEPGRLIARGTEDDKGAIATAMYAMKAVKDKQIELDKTIELMIYLAEESNWQPLREILKTWQPPSLNVTIDAEYPVVTAENGFSMIQVDIPKVTVDNGNLPYISEFSGGSFATQIPEDAKVVIKNADNRLMEKLKRRALTHHQLKFSFIQKGSELIIGARGKSAHSSTPEYGVNAIAFLADILKDRAWGKSAAGLTVSYLNDLVGTGLHAEKFGEIAYQDDFMGAMTLAPTVIKATDDGGVNINLNLRRPAGKTAELLKQQTNAALDAWQQQHQVKLANVRLYFGEPMVVTDAPHVQPLLGIFSHFTGIKDPKPLSIGGSTNAKLMPSAVSFGPSMPGVEYTGHSEHEFITVKQIKLNLAMYTAMMIELGKTKR